MAHLNDPASMKLSSKFQLEQFWHMVDVLLNFSEFTWDKVSQVTFNNGGLMVDDSNE